MNRNGMTIPYLEPTPTWWRVRPEMISERMKSLKAGRSVILTHTPKGLPVYAAFYGNEDAPPSSGNWASVSSAEQMAFYHTRKDKKQTVILCAGIHGNEVEGTAFLMYLSELLETGCNPLNRDRSRILDLIRQYRLILLPCINMDGRSISPDHLRNAKFLDMEIASRGCWMDGSIIGWPDCKRFFPLPLDKVRYPGGYVNSEGYNIQHDASAGNIKTEEAKAILQLAEREQPDLFLNLHSGTRKPEYLAPSALNYPAHITRSLELRKTVMNRLAEAGFSKEPPVSEALRNTLDINTQVTFCSGALAITFESQSRFEQTLADRIEILFLLLETLLKEGLKKTFSDRSSIVNTKHFIQEKKS